jgi:hypothetical protein
MFIMVGNPANLEKDLSYLGVHHRVLLESLPFLLHDLSL